MNRTYINNYPIILGLFGEAGTGKTSTAQSLSPPSRVVTGEEAGIFWEHLSFAMPLYAMANIRQSTLGGELGTDRACYEIHSTLVKMFGNSPLYGAPLYEDLFEMVLKIVDLPMPIEGKPRSWLQHVGTEICRGYDPNCWVNWMKQKINEEYDAWKKENKPDNFKYQLADVDNSDSTLHEDIDEDPLKYAVAISDGRFRNEADYINSMPNGLLVRLTARPEVVRERLFERDGVLLDPEQMNHPSEIALQQIPMEMFDLVLDTSDLTLEEQVKQVRNFVETFTGDLCQE